MVTVDELFSTIVAEPVSLTGIQASTATTSGYSPGCDLRIQARALRA